MKRLITRGRARRLLATAAAALFLAGVFPAGRAAAAGSEARARKVYPLPIDPGGAVAPGALDALLGSLRQDFPQGPRQLVLLVHGFAATRPAAEKEYETIAGRLMPGLGAQAEQAAIVGVYWPASPGPMASWLPRAFERRLLHPIGLGATIHDPYRTIAWRASSSGRTGLRQGLFALQAAFPVAAVHLLTHSLGAEVVLNALAPDLRAEGGELAPAFEPARDLKVASVVMTGADLDARVFVKGDQSAAARAALDRSGLWWFTVPPGKRKDLILEGRRFDLGRRALGNTGPRFTPEDADRLLRERRLVLDSDGVPPDHWFLKYYAKERCAAVGAAIQRLAPVAVGSSEAVAGSREVLGSAPDLLGTLDEVLAAPATPEALAPYLSSHSATVRLYAAWRLRNLGGRGELWEREFTVPAARREVEGAR